jgi:UDP-N-acetyl-D-glucosamine dehydrogenase
MTVGIVGLGYVGLPLAVAFAEEGHKVVGIDSNAARIRQLEAGRSPVEDIDDGRLARITGSLELNNEYEALAGCETVIICVPTPLDSSHQPDLSYLRDATRSLAAILAPGQLVVLESTSYPGTTREELLPVLEAGDRRVGVDFHLAFSPERIDPGRVDFTIRTTPKLVGGVTPECAEKAAALYREVCDEVIILSSPDAAELTKLLENIFRSVNIALVNELSQLCHRLGIDVWEVIEAAATKPFGFMRFDPGPGMGGHCLPVDPFYLAFKAREIDFYPEFIELAGKVNQAQPKFCVERIERILNEAGKPVQGSRVMIVGASYKGGVGDTRESPALKIIEMLAERGAAISYHDPFVATLPQFELSSIDLDEGLAQTDLVVIVTAHPGIDHTAVVESAPLALDLRGVTRGIEADGLQRL